MKDLSTMLLIFNNNDLQCFFVKTNSHKETERVFGQTSRNRIQMKVHVPNRKDNSAWTMAIVNLKQI